MTSSRLVVIGGSSGAIDALRVITGGLPADFPAAVCAVVHMSPESPGMLARILERASALPVVTAESGMPLEAGRLYVPQADHHLLVEPGRLLLTRGPRENRFRPAIDPLFRSAAQVFGPAAVGVVLTGHLDDGTAGLWAIKQLGGVAIVQDPADALFPSMPEHAARYVAVDHAVPLSGIAPLLMRIVAAPAAERVTTAVPAVLRTETRIAREENAVDAGLEQIATPSPFSCPECHGVLLRLKDAHPLRFRCHTGHAYSVESLMAAVNEGIEEALWNAVRALEEGGLLLQHVSEHEGNIDARATEALAGRAQEARRLSEAVRQLVTARGALFSTHA